MQTAELQDFTAERAPGAHRVSFQGARALYFALLDDERDQCDDAALQTDAARFLADCIEQAAPLDCDLPLQPSGLGAWVDAHTGRVLADYQHYLVQRRGAGPRQYFATRSHALHFLTAVAPTKTVDGAWLYGLLAHWQDSRFTALIRIYLEELGNGQPDQNHVVLYQRLLASNGCERWEHLGDDHFVQGAIQLALSRHAERFLPELIGFNLGYEQLPLHLLITAFELNELGIDPTYFGLHVTVDNADSGHARQALQGLRACLPVLGDRQAFYRRVMQGYRLNELGASTISVIADFDLEQEMLAVLARKSVAGKQAHAGYCRIGGRSVNDWLADPAQMPAFVAALQSSGWIRRGQPAQDSRFWKLIEGERADMFGVFSAYELQIIGDWIESPQASQPPTPPAPPTPPTPPPPQQVPQATGASAPPARSLSFRARQKLLDRLAPAATLGASGAAKLPSPGRERRAMVRPRANDAAFDKNDDGNDFNAELRELTVQLAQAPDRRAAMDLLGSLMAPTRHHTGVGLQATRIFVRLFGTDASCPGS